tara:strand:- start:515 stop:910 length:396 start_codon:yes stop_codon:yes gene_type:complete
LLTWLAVKEFCKKAWKFVVDQWLFFLAAAIGVFGFIAGSRGNKAKEVLDIRRKAENEERTSRQDAQARTEEVMRILNEKMDSLSEEQRAAVGEIIKEHNEDFEKEILDNRDKPLDHVVGELAAKYGLTKVD